MFLGANLRDEVPMEITTSVRDRRKAIVADPVDTADAKSVYATNEIVAFRKIPTVTRLELRYRPLQSFSDRAALLYRLGSAKLFG